MEQFENLKKIWLNKTAVVITILQLLSPLIFKREGFFFLSLAYYCMSWLLATIIINKYLSWLEKKGDERAYSEYLAQAPCTFQGLRFGMGFLVSAIVALVNSIRFFQGIENHAVEIIVSWYFIPFVSVFISGAMIQAGWKERLEWKDRVKVIFAFPKAFFFIFFEKDSAGNVRLKLSTLVNFLLVVIVMGVILLYNMDKLWP